MVEEYGKKWNQRGDIEFLSWYVLILSLFYVCNQFKNNNSRYNIPNMMINLTQMMTKRYLVNMNDYK